MPTRSVQTVFSIHSTAVFLFVVTVAPGIASAQGGQFSQNELRALPRVCLAQRFIHGALRPPIVPEDERQQWELRLGADDYLAFHHYCWALIFLRRASAASAPHIQAHNYNEAIQNFAYVQRNASSLFPLMPEVNLRKGQAHRLAGEDGFAAREFLEAIRLKQDYTPAYAALAELYVDLDDLKAAEQILAEGLEHAPNSEILLGKRRELETIQKDRK